MQHFVASKNAGYRPVLDMKLELSQKALMNEFEDLKLHDSFSNPPIVPQTIFFSPLPAPPRSQHS